MILVSDNMRLINVSILNKKFNRTTLVNCILYFNMICLVFSIKLKVIYRYHPT